MKIAIIYAGKTGTTRDCVEILKNKLTGQDVSVFDLNVTPPPASLDGFDSIVVGGPVRLGKLYRPVQKYLSANSDALSAQRTVYFVVCAYADRVDEYFEDFLTPEQRRSALWTVSFGGTLKLDRQKNVFMKLIVRAMRNDIIENGDSDDESMVRILPEINPGEISKTADVICSRI